MTMTFLATHEHRCRSRQPCRRAFDPTTSKLYPTSTSPGRCSGKGDDETHDWPTTRDLLGRPVREQCRRRHRGAPEGEELGRDREKVVRRVEVGVAEHRGAGTRLNQSTSSPVPSRYSPRRKARLRSRQRSRPGATRPEYRWDAPNALVQLSRVRAN